MNEFNVSTNKRMLFHFILPSSIRPSIILTFCSNEAATSKVITDIFEINSRSLTTLSALSYHNAINLRIKKELSNLGSSQ